MIFLIILHKLTFFDGISLAYGFYSDKILFQITDNIFVFNDPYGMYLQIYLGV